MFVQQIKLLFLNIFNLFRRALCCISIGRRRKPSLSEPLDAHGGMNVVVVVDSNNYKSPTAVSGAAGGERDWNSWDDSPRTVSEHIEQYRQRIAKPPSPQDEEPEPDFFSELAPEIKPQLKYYLGDDKKEKTDFSRLEAKTDVPIAYNADLEDWMDEDAGGWEELDSEQTKQLIREKRREMRSQRQKGMMKSTTGIEATKLDTNGFSATRINQCNNYISHT